jgi:exodeoxyribonuclease VII large subunit
VESMSRAGQGALFEQFLQLKAKLEAQGLFDPVRKRDVPQMPRGIGIVTSLGAAALHDVVTALRRRVPHLPVVIAPALVQGASAPAELIRALSNLYLRTEEGRGLEGDLTDKGSLELPVIDVILLVRGGGSIDDLWAFNNEALALTIAQSPVPIVCGVGHETDFTIADFVADLRAPTPTAAAELVAQPQEVWRNVVDSVEGRLQDAVVRRIDTLNQRLDSAAARMGRPSGLVARERLKLASTGQRLQSCALYFLKHKTQQIRGLEGLLPVNCQRGLALNRHRLDRAALRLSLLDPTLVLKRGYAWLADSEGHAVTRATQLHPGQPVRATLADGTVDLTVSQPH